MNQFFTLLTQSLGMALFFAAHLAGLFMIPFGLPGLWLQVLACVTLAAFTQPPKPGWWWIAGFVAMSLLGEVIEFFAGQIGAKKFGGSHKATWGALLGGMAGAIIGGIPIPLIGNIVASFIGTFAGALLGEMQHQKALKLELRVGIGALLGRAAGMGAKIFIGLLILLLSIAALLV